MTRKNTSPIGWQIGPPRVAKAMSERFKNPVFFHVEMLQSGRKSIKKPLFLGFLGSFRGPPEAARGRDVVQGPRDRVAAPADQSPRLRGLDDVGMYGLPSTATPTEAAAPRGAQPAASSLQLGGEEGVDLAGRRHGGRLVEIGRAHV